MSSLHPLPRVLKGQLVVRFGQDRVRLWGPHHPSPAPRPEAQDGDKRPGDISRLGCVFWEPQTEKVMWEAGVGRDLLAAGRVSLPPGSLPKTQAGGHAGCHRYGTPRGGCFPASPHLFLPQAGAKSEGGLPAGLRTLGITRKAKVAPRSAGGCRRHCNAPPDATLRDGGTRNQQQGDPGGPAAPRRGSSGGANPRGCPQEEDKASPSLGPHHRLCLIAMGLGTPGCARGARLPPAALGKVRGATRQPEEPREPGDAVTLPPCPAQPPSKLPGPHQGQESHLGMLSEKKKHLHPLQPATARVPPPPNNHQNSTRSAP